MEHENANVSKILNATLDVSMRISAEDKQRIITLAGKRMAKTGKISHLSTIVRDYLKKGLEEGLLPIDEIEEE